MKRIIPAVLGATLVAASLTACSANAATTATEPTETKGPALVAPPAIASAGKLTVCTALSTGNPPTYFTDADNKPIGAEIEMAEWIGDHLGLETDFLDVAFASIIPTLQAGKCDVIMSSLYIKPERAEIVDFVPYLKSGSAVAVQKDNPEEITGMDDSLCGLTISAAVGKTAALLSEAQAEACASAGKATLEVVQTDQTTAAVQQLIYGQVEAYAGETPVVLYYQKLQPDTFEMAGEPFGLIDVGAAVNKGNVELFDAIGDAFIEMDKQGVYGEILDEWGMTDLAYTFN
jgi:polar amino acid transport system substrate-binding protein